MLAGIQSDEHPLNNMIGSMRFKTRDAAVAGLMTLLLAGSCAGEPVPEPTPSSPSGCPSAAGCGASIYGRVSASCGERESPLRNALVLMYVAREGTQVVQTYGLTDSDGNFAIALAPSTDYRLTLVDDSNGGEQRFEGPSLIHTNDHPIHRDLAVVIGCD